MSEKQFPPSVKRLLKARSEGKVVKSPMVSVAASWWVLVVVIIPSVAWVRDGSLVQWSRYTVWTPEVAISEALRLAARSIALLVGAVALSGVVCGVAQTKGLFLPSQLVRGFEQYRPGSFVNRIKQGAIDASVGIIRCCVVLFLLMPVFAILLGMAPTAWEHLSGGAIPAFSELLWELCIRGGLALTVIAGVAYALARWRFNRQHRMTLQEVREEHKDDEGDPHAKAHRKQEHRAMLFSEVEKRVRRAKVVIVRKADLVTKTGGDPGTQAQ